ncbi:zinc finger protein 184-like [Condylostylus longicornis]|uniref:zinc finger protein 184-like n=1 Tax=Condylostylus longicornis TaxID=2530218 RepID=UPI00244DF065|nr:zinc finger protein 184-like [Condylostylus longicornis]
MTRIVNYTDRSSLKNQQQDPDCSNIEYLIENIDDDIATQEISGVIDDEEELYQCSVCKYSFRDVMRHIKMFHKDQSILIEATNKNKTESQLNSEYDYEAIKKTNVECISDTESGIITNEFNDVLIDNKSSEKKADRKDEQYDSADYDKNLEKYHEEFSILNTTSVLKNESKINYQTKTCSICKTTFSSVKNLKLHARIHYPVKSKSYIEALAENENHSLLMFYCELCKKSFDVKLQDQHSKFHRLNTINTICKICNKQFKSMESFRMHLTLHEGREDSIFGSSLKKLTNMENNTTLYPYACRHCNKSFKRPHEKVKHERIHTGEKPYKCDVCGKSFRVSYSLTLHLRTHTGVRPYVCTICNKRFKGFSTYANHSQTHSEERKFKCPECPKMFKTAVQMHGHKNTHKKPFFCSLCNRPFATMHNVEVHMETHKNETSKKKFKYCCNICGASYGRSFALEEHKKEMHSSLDLIEKHLEYFCKDEAIISTECILSTDELLTS